jgi:hypothetical protein
MAERVIGVWRLGAFMLSEQQQPAIAGIDQGMIPSEIIAELPVKAAAANLVAAIPRLAAIAA